MKKFITIIMVMVMALSMTGCVTSKAAAEEDNNIVVESTAVINQEIAMDEDIVTYNMLIEAAKDEENAKTIVLWSESKTAEGHIVITMVTDPELDGNYDVDVALFSPEGILMGYGYGGFDTDLY